MKNFIKFLLMSLVLISASVSQSAVAQSSTKYSSRNTQENIAKLSVTTDSTLTYIDSVDLATNETGIVEALVIGYAKDTAYSVRGRILVDFNKRRGTLTLGTVTEDIPITRDAVLANTALGGATFTAVSANGKIYIRIKGKAAYTMRWYSITKKYSQQTVL